MRSTTALISVIAALSAVVQAIPPCQSGLSRATFAQCCYNSLTDPNSKPGAADQFAACSSLAANSSAYYSCLCRLSQLLTGCYTSFCVADPGLQTQQQYSIQFCAAAQQASAAPNQTSPTAPLMTLPPLPPLSGTVPPPHTTSFNAAPTPPSTGASAKGAGEANGANMLMNAMMAAGVAGAIAVGL
ncbi:hypothetical protein BASA50_005489 [Batrachochytrium salamandrivorans]|uniref:Extracellular membrane protein CFEM domain-containing protein n=1 Tax=Batrachochytrium salamandrivorans TaxID=1357716 RepID=A0ABQ8FCG3_9FUNG|nr:hypothetical protein BASA60_005057 [Batrachochytrium salamandrivorans]KAH6577725.1 hypothetical protein BASA62_000706 [Batrachochytrium salamandrivorans]KAH6584878.1 hypothetical protein BASA61_007246 [Batrachochytrium salamandrivorans]KAH6595909.1 hypothetical protein BASA50_005489 [Batrachochytrium salamandrivorans]KAH9249270.1 hypothetical protein BASA81_012997 [Batrachochytrium salamandrivorans]